MVVIEVDYDEIKLQNIPHSYDVISVTPSLLRYRKTPPK